MEFTVPLIWYSKLPGESEPQALTSDDDDDDDEEESLVVPVSGTLS
jgi:hypothetical protein